jgi:hypothetical protein
MKFKTLIIIFLCFSKTLFSQDSLRVETVVDSTFKPPQYVAAYDDVSLSHKEAKWLVKVDWMDYVLHLYNINAFDVRSSGKLPHLSVEFERKIKPNISLNFGLHTNKAFIVSTLKAPILLSVEPRYYFKMANRIAEGKSADNLNGSYIGLRTDFRVLKSENERYFEPINYGFMLNYGIQKRIFNNWYIDYHVGVGAANTTYGGARWQIIGGTGDPQTKVPNHQWESQLESKFTLGLAFGGGKKVQTNTCDLFRCFEEEKSLWKFDIQHLIPSIMKSRFKDGSSFVMGLSAAYEHKIGQSSWSINTELGGHYITNPPSSYNALKNVHVGLALEPRFYYNQKKRIAKGLSANNLSGNYFSLETSVNYDNLKVLNASSQDIWESTVMRFAPKWGMQRRLFKNGFFDLSVTPLEFVAANKNTFLYGKSNFHIYKLGGNVQLPKIDFKIGFAF